PQTVFSPRIAFIEALLSGPYAKSVTWTSKESRAHNPKSPIHSFRSDLNRQTQIFFSDCSRRIMQALTHPVQEDNDETHSHIRLPFSLRVHAGPVGTGPTSNSQARSRASATPLLCRRLGNRNCSKTKPVRSRRQDYRKR